MSLVEEGEAYHFQYMLLKQKLETILAKYRNQLSTDLNSYFSLDIVKDELNAIVCEYKWQKYNKQIVRLNKRLAKQEFDKLWAKPFFIFKPRWGTGVMTQLADTTIVYQKLTSPMLDKLFEQLKFEQEVNEMLPYYAGLKLVEEREDNQFTRSISKHSYERHKVNLSPEAKQRAMKYLREWLNINGTTRLIWK